jgi:magnesium transporter
MPSWDSELREVRSEQLSIILGPTWVLTFQERRGDVFEAVRERIRQSVGRIRRLESGYLAFALLDAVVDNYFAVLEHFGDELEPLEERVLGEPGPQTVHALHGWKREMMGLKKAVWPLRETFAGMERSESKLFGPETRVFLRGLHDHTVQVIELVESIRETLGGLLELHVTMAGNRMNEVMKVLTIIATIFIPLTFIAGVYGMNFENMPELKWPWAYFGVWAVMFAVTVAMIIFFRKKRWL